MARPARIRPGLDRPDHARAGQTIAPLRGQVARACAVHQQPHAHSAQSRSLQGLNHRLTSARHVQDVGFDLNLGVCRIQFSDERGEPSLCPLQQGQGVTAVDRGCGSHAQSCQVKSATKGRWSDIWCQIRADAPRAPQLLIIKTGFPGLRRRALAQLRGEVLLAGLIGALPCAPPAAAVRRRRPAARRSPRPRLPACGSGSAFPSPPSA